MLAVLEEDLPSPGVGQHRERGPCRPGREVDGRELGRLLLATTVEVDQRVVRTTQPHGVLVLGLLPQQSDQRQGVLPVHLVEHPAAGVDQRGHVGVGPAGQHSFAPRCGPSRRQRAAGQDDTGAATDPQKVPEPPTEGLVHVGVPGSHARVRPRHERFPQHVRGFLLPLQRRQQVGAGLPVSVHGSLLVLLRHALDARKLQGPELDLLVNQLLPWRVAH